MSGSAATAEAPKVRRNWLAGAAAAAAITVPVTAFTGTAQAATVSQQKAAVATTAVLKKAAPTFDQRAAAVAKKYVGDPYRYGGTTPAGFDCSGLTQYVYKHTAKGKKIQRTADAQYLEFKRIAKSAAKPGDLVFFHDTSSPGSYVYHVGVYEGGTSMVAATTSGSTVELQSFTWAGDTVTFGTITH
ncbi:MAG TPA: C40 family peptidase [Trebonia sp.]|jgi:cell wall-associated NlpC family hydrolase|nr:C40 family peptidase [Trebonia sp.]